MSIYRVRINTYIEAPADMQTSWTTEQQLEAIFAKLTAGEAKTTIQKLYTPEEVHSLLNQQQTNHQQQIQNIKEECEDLISKRLPNETEAKND
jgi:hypothetical protein